MDLSPYKEKLKAASARYDHAKRRAAEERQAYQEAKKHLHNLLEAQALCQEVAKKVQETAHEQIASVVTRCLETIFGKELRFRIDFVQRRGKTEAELWFEKQGHRVSPVGASGLGAVDIAALALRLCTIKMSRPKKRPILISDEPFRFVNGVGFQERVGELLETLASETGVQFVLATDDDWLKNVGNVIDLD